MCIEWSVVVKHCVHLVTVDVTAALRYYAYPNKEIAACVTRIGRQINQSRYPLLQLEVDLGVYLH
jgi:hypothetical protein